MSYALRSRLLDLLHPPNPFLMFARPGHFYSPVPDYKLIAERGESLIDPSVREIPGVNLRESEQLALLDTLAGFYAEQPFPLDQSPETRYYFNNDAFLAHDALMLYGMLRHYRPRRVVEVGCGYSSAVMLDTAERFLNDAVSFTFIEPDPSRLLALMRPSDRRQTVHATVVQSVPMTPFLVLRANDILFIDSSHVGKIGSDVLHLLHNVLPALQPGVLIHVHDVGWPFEYPIEWYRSGRAWNEAYLVRSFLQFNDRFEIRLFNGFIAQHHRERLARLFPLALRCIGASLWMQKTI